MVVLETIGFLSVILLVWFDELLDIPHLLLGAEATALNWRESLFESVIIGIFGSIIINYTKKVFQRMKSVEGILPICASCKKIRDEEGNWHEIDSYIRDRSEAEFSHGVCPECAERLYPEFNPYKKKDK